MKMNLGLKDMVKINQLFETALEVDVPLIISNKEKAHIYMMSEATYNKLIGKKETIRDKEIKNKLGKTNISKHITS